MIVYSYNYACNNPLETKFLNLFFQMWTNAIWVLLRAHQVKNVSTLLAHTAVVLSAPTDF